jgi:thioredoxin-like negative regulator of GroEL
VRLDAIDVLLQLGRSDEAGQLLASEYTLEAERANALRARLALAAGAADTGELETKLATNPADHATRLDLARAYAGQNRFREALENRWRSSSATASSTKAPAARHCCRSSRRWAAANSTTIWFANSGASFPPR